MKKIILFVILLTSLYTSSFIIAQDTLTTKVFFNTDCEKLEPSETVKLTDFVKSIDSIQISKIFISGYCDDMGSRNYNDVLSAKRAEYVKNILLNSDFERHVIVTQGKGEVPVLESELHNIEKHRAQNRRAEITFVKNGKIENAKKRIISDNMQIGDKITLENILFPGRQAVLLPESLQTLENLVDNLKEQKEYQIVVLGHVCCEPIGRDGYNQDTGLRNLSVARAKAVYDYLINNGIEANRLEYKGLKANYPLGKGDKYDKRVEIMIKNIIRK